jgi:periplasmic copper chaperone A
MTHKNRSALRGMAACALLFAAPALAHVELTVNQSAVPGPYTATFTVEHGCSGSPTLLLRVQIPEGIIVVKPSEKAGWAVSTLTGKFKATYNYNGAKVSQGVTEVDWSGFLPDKMMDTFSFDAYLTDALKPNMTLYFPIVQECQVGANHWVQIPAKGKTEDDYQFPAAALKLLPAGK